MSIMNLTEEKAIALIEKFESDIETFRLMLELLFDYCTNNNYNKAIEMILSKKLVDFSNKADNIAKWAIQNENVEVLKSLLGDDSVTLNDGTIFSQVLEKDNIEMFNLLLPKMKIPSDAIFLAMNKNKNNIVDILVSKGLYSPTDSCILMSACEYGYINVVKALLKHPETNAAYNRNYPIQKAAKMGHYEIVKLLMEDKRVDPSDDGNRALCWAAETGRTKIVELLLNCPKVNPSVCNNDPIRSAMSNNHIDVVKLLIPRIDLSTITNQKILDIAKEMELGKNIWDFIIEFMKKHQIKKIHYDKNKKFDVEFEPTGNILLVCNEFSKLAEKRNISTVLVDTYGIRVQFDTA